MSILLRNSLWIVPIVLAASVITAKTGSAAPLEGNIQELPANTQLTLEKDQSHEDPNLVMDQVTSVSQLSDVQPTDWAFQALQSLVERYGCIAGYPDSSFRGNRALTRYEFAAGLNACLNRVNELIATSTADLVNKQDLETLQKLQQEYADGLVEVRGRLDGLEGRTAILESQQFSTTTKLNAEVIFGLGSVFGGDRALNSDQWRTINAATTPAARNAARNAAFGASGSGLQNNTIFSDRIRLNLITSFTGKDQLFTRLEANNTTAFSGNVTGTNMTRTSWDTTNSADNSVQLGKLYYRFPVGEKLNVIVDAIGGEFYDNFNTINPLLSSTPIGSLSRFGRFSPIYRASNTSSGSNTGSGVSAVFKFSDAVTLSGGYLARRGSDPSAGKGLFDGTYGALAQLTFQPNKDFTLGLTYAHSYLRGANNDGDVVVSGSYGSGFANNPFNSSATTPINTSANHYGLEASYRVHPQITVGGWVGYTQAIAENSSGTNPVTNTVNSGDRADIWNWAITLAFPDLGKKGNLGGIILGQPPKVTSNDFGPSVISPTTARRQDSDTSFHIEALYRYQVNNNLSITPGLIVILNPENNNNNDTIYTGVLRTTFRF
ncbi:iron uptake porin [Calothrix sp. PCC 7507]|uniref:iron uptake porin n=1 Tax=Calothrix sp. PCC 7507 TaxID=99598 RepID=UPI00029F30B9|nr:iron uptake porin [Calothrix sp. PCC 7507]AFY31596.1 cyanobacterial porin [Calothrix sp. PCC 7507]